MQLILAMALPTSSFAKTVTLKYFDPTKYDQLVRSIEPGDRLILQTYKRTLFSRPHLVTSEFEIEKFLGEGPRTLVFSLLDRPDQVLRLSQSLAAYQENRPIRHFITTTIRGAVALIKHHVPITRLFERSENFFVVADRLEGPTLLDFLKNPLTFAPRDRAVMSDALVKFGIATEAFSEIGDFHSDQLAFERATRTWILRDWQDQHEFAKQVDDPSIFDTIALREIGLEALGIDDPNSFSAKLFAKVNLAIKEQRRRSFRKRCNTLLHLRL